MTLQKINRFLAIAAVVFITGCASAQASAPAAEGGNAPAADETAAETIQAGQAGEKDAELSEEGQDGTAAEGTENTSKEGGPAETQEPKELVTVVIPTVYESVASQKEADEIRDKNGYESAVLSEDGSLTIVMEKSRHEEMLRSFKKSVDEGIAEIIGAEGDSAIDKIEYNDEYSVFTVTVSADEIGIVERQAADELVMYGTLYHIYSGNDADHIQVDYVRSGSGEVIETADSGSLDKAY